jgi:hypothetical protein
MLAKSVGACSMVTFRSAASASAPACQSPQTSPAWTFYPFSNRGRSGYGAASDLFKSLRRLRGCLVLAGAKVSEVDVQEYRRERARSVWKHTTWRLAAGCRTNSRMGSRCFCGAEIDVVGIGQPHRCSANGHSRAYIGRHGARNAGPICRRQKIAGWRGLPARLFVAYWNVSVAVLGRHRGTIIGIRGKRADVWSRTQSFAVACRAAESLRAAMAWVANTVAAISAADTKVILVICFSLWCQKPRKRSAPCCEDRPALGDISSRAFNEA